MGQWRKWNDWGPLKCSNASICWLKCKTSQIVFYHLKTQDGTGGSAVNGLDEMFHWEKGGLSQMCYCKIRQGWRKTKGKHHTERICWGMGNSAETSDQRRTFSARNQIILFLSKSNGPIWGTDRQDTASQPEWFYLTLKCVCMYEFQTNTGAEHKELYEHNELHECARVFSRELNKLNQVRLKTAKPANRNTLQLQEYFLNTVHRGKPQTCTLPNGVFRYINI